MASTERRVEVSAAISVTEALTIVGDTGNPADVVVRNTAGTVTKTSGSNNDTAHRVFVINNAGAVLSGLVAEDGRAGGGIGIKNIGGDCIVRPDGTFALIDFNDFPSFAPCANEAARALVDSIVNNYV